MAPIARRPLASLAFALATLALAGLAGAETPLEHAKELTSHATVEYNVGHFEQALDLYSKAYEAFPTPALLFDIGQCHRMLAHHERAIFFFQGYLRQRPDAANRPLVEQLLEDSRRQLDAQHAAADRAEEEKRAAEAAVPPAPPAATPLPAVAPPTVEAPPPPPPGNPAMRIAGLATAGAGVVLVGTAAVLGLRAWSLSNQITQVATSHGTWTAQDQANYDAGKHDASAATILYVVGGVVLAGGGVVTYLGWPRAGAEGRVAAAVAPQPGGASVAVAGRF